MTHTRIRLPYIHEWFTCETCGETWGVAYRWQEALYNMTRLGAEMAKVELNYQMHRTNHKLEIIEAYVKENGL